MAFSPSKAIDARVVLLAGDDSQSRNQALKDILKELGLTPSDQDIERFNADEKPFADWIGIASTFPFGVEKRIVIVRYLGRANVTDLGGPKKVAEQLAILQDFSLLILVADELTNKSGDTTAGSITSWKKAVKDANGLVAEFSEEGVDVIKEVRQIAKDNGKEISASAARLLTEFVGGKLSEARSETQKLILFVGDSNVITEQDIKDTVTPDAEYSVFRLIDLVIEGKPGLALSQMRGMFSKTAKVEEEAFPRVFPMFMRQFRLLWQARACHEAKVQPSRAPAAIADAFLSKPNFGKERDWLQNRTMRTASQVSFPQLTACLQILMETDGKMKGVTPQLDGYETLEQMILKMGAVFQSRR
ncbi:MAG: DNA polymerase III subunit delta [Fimbriimonadaceae bacterium]